MGLYSVLLGLQLISSDKIMISSKLFNEFGLNEYESKVYLSLIRLTTAKVSEIAKNSGVPSNKVYESLNKLTEKGFVSQLDLNPKQYQVIGVEKFRMILEEKEKKIKNLKIEINLLEKNLNNKTNSPESLARVFKGKDKIFQMLDEVIPKIEKYQYTSAGGLTLKSKSSRLIQKQIKKGVDYRFLGYFDYERIKTYKKLIEIGVKIKFIKDEKRKGLRFSTFDDKFCRITIGKPQIEREEDYLTFWIQSPAFAILLKETFLHLWKESNTLDYYLNKTN